MSNTICFVHGSDTGRRRLCSRHTARILIATLGTTALIAFSAACSSPSPGAVTSSQGGSSASSRNPGSSATIPTQPLGDLLDQLQVECTGIAQIPDPCSDDIKVFETDIIADEKLVPVGSTLRQDLNQMLMDTFPVIEGPIPAQLVSDYQKLVSDNLAAAA